MIHELKTLPVFFQAIVDGRKTFEVRRNDRGFEPGDKLFLREWSLETGYTGRTAEVCVPYVYHVAGAAEWLCVMSIQFSPSERARLFPQGAPYEVEATEAKHDAERVEVHPTRADHEAAPTAGHEGDHEGRAVEPRPEAAGVAAVGPGVAPGSVGSGPGLSYRDAMGITHARALGLLSEAPAPKGPDRSGHAAGCEVGRCARWCPMLKPIGAP